MFWNASCFYTDALEMTIFKDQLEVFQGQDVVLDCKVTGYTPAVLNLSFVAVEWRFVSTQQLVYSFNGGFIDALRPGATVTLENLKRGDASLHLPKVQIEEEGEYKCIVYVTPSKAEKSSSVRVLGKYSEASRRVCVLFPHNQSGSPKFVKESNIFFATV
uniref:Ig-like domain-containing protein n=1 Tax=Callorhinchus milii TaxID=7868 RepID=A0A4W3INN5_CALMI